MDDRNSPPINLGPRPKENRQAISNSNWKGEAVLIRDQYYSFKITFYNTVTKRPLNVPFKVVDSLAIEENFTNWWTKGWIVLNNTLEVIERATAIPDNPLSSNQEQAAFFAFRHDGRNRVNIKIETVPSGNSLITPENWSMDYDFVIYDVEDIDTDSAITKLKKFYFIDERYQILAERNIPWSTATHGPASETAKQRNVSISSLTDEERKMLPNEAIKSIIKTAACNDFTMSSLQTSEIKVGFDDSGSIDKPNKPLDNIDEVNWSLTTSTSGKAIFYTSPANSNALKDINYMLDFASGPENDPVFLKLGRFDKKWSLVSLSDVFSKAIQIERLSIQDGLEPNTKTYINRAALLSDNGKILNVSSGRTSTLRNYKFAPMAPVDDMRLMNRPIHKMDFSSGIYSIYFEENKVENLFESINKLGQKGLYTFTSGTGMGGNQVWLNINRTKIEGLALENTFLTQGSPSLMATKMLKDVLFLNQALYFQSDGLTLRQPGTFLFIDRADSSDKNLFDDKFLGQWFVSRVVHYFDHSKYITDVYANKIDGLNKHWDVLDKVNW